MTHFFKNIGRMIVLISAPILLTGCSFNFELTSQKTALENQVMGSYKELDDEVLLMASVRGVNKDGTKKEAKIASDNAKKAQSAKQNQDFNRDDLDEFKERQIVGESNSGEVIILPKGTGLAETAPQEDLKLAQAIAGEENRDRDTIIQRIISSNENLNSKDLPDTKRVYRKTIVDASPTGTWIQNTDGLWERKKEVKEAKEVSK